MTPIPRNVWTCPDCEKEVDIWHRVCDGDGARGKYRPSKIGCPDCEKYMEIQEETDE